MDSKEKEQSLKLAEHYFRDNNYSFAKHILGKVIEIDANNSKANELLAYIYANTGEIDVAFQLLTVACNENDCSPEALYFLGSMRYVYYEAGNLSLRPRHLPRTRVGPEPLFCAALCISVEYFGR